MGKNVFIAEKKSVGESFAAAMKVPMKSMNGYMEGDKAIITWCVGHLVTMSYPEIYDSSLKKWRLDTLPFLPKEFLYEILPGNAGRQFKIVSEILCRDDVDSIYVCTDSGREGEYIYRLVDMMAHVGDKKKKYRVWIDSQTDEEIIRGIREAKPLSEYDDLSAAAYLRAKEDYLMGINFSRLLSVKYGNEISAFNNTKYTAIAVGRVMTCVLGLIVRRERQIREFKKTPFYRVVSQIDELKAKGEWRCYEDSAFAGRDDLYKDSGFLDEQTAKACASKVFDENPHRTEAGVSAVVTSVSRKTEKKNPPLLFNLAELQNECSKRFHISPDETLKCVQSLYEKKLVTYPRTDARVLSSAVAKEIDKNIKGLLTYEPLSNAAEQVLKDKSYVNLVKTRYVDDSKITDHYALVPTGKGAAQIDKLEVRLREVYDLIARRFLSIFFPAAQYKKASITAEANGERFISNFKVLNVEGYLKVAPLTKKKPAQPDTLPGDTDENEDEDVQADNTEELLATLSGLKKGSKLTFSDVFIKEGETKPPKRYTSGSMILAMENAGQLIEDEELRSQIKGAGIGTSATRAEILNKLVTKKYIKLNQKTQVLEPLLLGEEIYDVVESSIRPLLNPELTASWEKGLSMVEDGRVTSEEYMTKLENYIRAFTDGVKGMRNTGQLREKFRKASQYYKKAK